MRILAVNPAAPREDRLAEAVDVLTLGGVVALATDTFYGLAADAFQAGAMARINRLKGKAEGSPILLLLANRAQVDQVAGELPAVFGRLADRFWPGPLTLVVRATPELPRAVTGDRRTVAVRVPGLSLPRRLAGALGRPISGVSANRTGAPPCRTAGEVVRSFPGELEMILDGGPTPGGAPSTIVDLTGDPPRVLREGLLPSSDLRPFLDG